MSLHCSLWCVHMHLNDATCIGVVLASSPGRFFQREGEGGKKRPGIHCTGGSARALNC